MGRTEQLLRNLRERLDQGDEVDLRVVTGEMDALVDRIPKADAPLEPVLRRFAGWLAGAGEDPAQVVAARSVVDAGIQYAAHRDHPQRDALLQAAEELVDALAAQVPTDEAEPAAPSSDLPTGFVGELPPESTLDDAALLLVQLEPGDRYGISSLVEILERLTKSAPDDRVRALLREAVDLLTRADSEPTEETLERVGELLEAVTDGDSVGGGEAEGGDPASQTRAGRIEGDETGDAAGAAEAASGTGGAGGDESGGGAVWRPGPDVDPDLMREFLLESGDLMRSAEQALLALESDPSDGEGMNVVFRAFHTIKGTSAFLGVEQAAELCHHAESLFSKVRDGDIAFDGSIADLSLASVDTLTRILEQVGVALDGDEPDPVAGLPALARRLQRATAGQAVEAVEPVEPVAAEATESSEGPADAPAPTKQPARGPSVVKGRAREGGGMDRDTSVRVRTDRLDRLVDMVGELVIAHSMIAQDEVVRDDTQHGLAKKVAHGGKIVRELQDLSMALRMVPLKSTFAKLQRLVRDLARKSGKQVRLLTEGEETEIDRTMVDVLGDPLVHMIRNAMDHGLEPAEDRESTGKDPVGTLWLRSYHAGGNVVVELEDDGRGMSRDRIVAKAMERGLIRSGDGLTDGEVWKLVFEPGFSTAETVTDVSGRGVGMDVVRRNIEALRGRIEVDSTAGEGTKVTLRLPLTLAITEGMLMRVGQERYILPTLSIERNVRPTAEMLSTVAGRGEMLMMRDELLPIVRLHELFDVGGGRQEIEEGLLVVIGAAERRCALLVDELLGQHQVVVKSLGDGLGKVKGVTGGAVLGDGTVGLILDAGELVAMARNGTATQAA